MDDHSHQESVSDGQNGDRKAGRLDVARSILEAVILMIVGLGAGCLAASANYGLLMQPKFRWLTMGGALVVFAMGTTGLARGRRAGAMGSLAFLVLFAIVLIGRPFSENAPSSVSTGLRLPDAETVEDANYPMRDMRQLHMDIEDKGDLEGLAFSALGTAKRIPSSDGNGPVALMRSYMVCCAADAIAMGMRVTGDGLKAFKDGEWVVVRGVLTRLPEPEPIPPFRMGTATFSIVAGSHVIEPVEILPLITTLPSLVDQLSSQSTTRFAQALKTTGLLKKLDAKGPFTVFAPINEALDSVSPDVTDDPTGAEEKAIAEGRLSRHIVAGRYMEQDLYNRTTLSTIDGQVLHIRVENGRLYLENSRMLLSNVVARNGVIHIIYPSLMNSGQSLPKP